MKKLAQLQTTVIAFFAGGVVILAVYLLASGRGEEKEALAATSPTATFATPSVTASAKRASLPTSTATADQATLAPTATSVVLQSTGPLPTMAPATSVPTLVPSATARPPTATATRSPSPSPTRTATPLPTPTPAQGVWSGEWEVKCGSSSCGVMTLVQTGTSVTGTLPGKTTISATADGNHLVGTKNQGTLSPVSIEFWMEEDGAVWNGNSKGAETWCGWRPGTTTPNPCGIVSWVGSWQVSCGHYDGGLIEADCSRSELSLEQSGRAATGWWLLGSNFKYPIKATIAGTQLIGLISVPSGGVVLNLQLLPDGSHFQGDGANDSLEDQRNICGNRPGSEVLTIFSCVE